MLHDTTVDATLYVKSGITEVIKNSQCVIHDSLLNICANSSSHYLLQGIYIVRKMSEMPSLYCWHDYKLTAFQLMKTLLLSVYSDKLVFCKEFASSLRPDEFKYIRIFLVCVQPRTFTLFVHQNL